MRKINLNFVYAFLFFLLGEGCTQNDRDAGQYDYTLFSVDLKKENIAFSTLFENIHPVFLETNDSSLIGENPRISFTEE